MHRHQSTALIADHRSSTHYIGVLVTGEAVTQHMMVFGPCPRKKYSPRRASVSYPSVESGFGQGREKKHTFSSMFRTNEATKSVLFDKMRQYKSVVISDLAHSIPHLVYKTTPTNEKILWSDVSEAEVLGLGEQGFVPFAGRVAGIPSPGFRLHCNFAGGFCLIFIRNPFQTWQDPMTVSPVVYWS